MRPAPWALRRKVAAMRLLLAVVLALLVGGVPRLALAALGFEEPECSAQCEGSLGDETCPPTCSVGSCAKCPVALEAASPPRLEVVLVAVRAVAQVPAAPVAPPSSPVFHPPKA
jgi:hypothetical protein